MKNSTPLTKAYTNIMFSEILILNQNFWKIIFFLGNAQTWNKYKFNSNDFLHSPGSKIEQNNRLFFNNPYN